MFEANGTAQENESHETKALPMGKTKTIRYDPRYEKRLAKGIMNSKMVHLNPLIRKAWEDISTRTASFDL